MIEEANREPIMVLSHYQLIDHTGKILIGHSKSLTEKIILNLKDFDRI